MSAPSEGWKAVIYAGTTCPPGTADIIALLTGVDLSWTQTNRHWRYMGSVRATHILRGPLNWEGAWRAAYVNNNWLGTFDVGTLTFCGSITPRGGNSPCILGTITLGGGSLANMEMENPEAVIEEQTFQIYNMTFS
jgi:hypothetical protein